MEQNNSVQAGSTAQNQPAVENSEPVNSGTGEEQVKQPEQTQEPQEEKKYKNWIPPERFQEVIEQKKKLEEMLKQKEEMELAEKEEFKTLYEKAKEELEQYKPLSEKLQKYEEVVKNLANQEIEQVKQAVGEDKFNELVELLELDKLEPLQLVEKLPKIKKLAGLTSKPQVSWGQPVQTNQTDEKAEFEILKKKVANHTATGEELLRYKQLMAKMFN